MSASTVPTINCAEPAREGDERGEGSALLNAGTKFGPYEIVAPIGAGGMGEVYRARDTKLGRDVALKALPEAFARDSERMARMRREAQVLASLNHPNIAAIYGFEDSGATHALVMELVEGPTLTERIKASAIALDEALPIAKQIAEGIEYAHERGIVHRDLKPSNVKVTQDGQVKILDFGLAKAIEGEESATSMENSPTLSAMATHAGFLLGTAAYMSPEQARGKRADRRADIWAFGVVLFEMLSGKRLFAGETTSDTLAAVIRAEPDWNDLPEQTPPRIRELLQRCLKKDPRQRLQSIGDARIALEEVLSGSVQYDSSEAGGAKPPLQGAWRRALPWVLAGLLAIALAAALVILPKAMHEPPTTAVISQINPPANTTFAANEGYFGETALSPDGKRLAFVAVGSDGVQRLWVRPLDSTSAEAVAGTDGAEFPFWSPGGSSVGFFAKGKLYRTDLSGRSPFAITESGAGRGGSWGPDGTILFTPGLVGSIFRVPVSGGSPERVTQLSSSRKDFGHRWPQFLPDGRHFLFYVWSADVEKSAVYAGSLDGGEPKLVLQNESDALYASPGYLLFLRQGALMAQRFDLSTLQVSGDAQPLSTGVTFSVMPSMFVPPVTASQNGVVVYGAGITYGSDRLLWFDRSGKQIGQTGEPGYYETASISPQGDKLAVSVGNAQTPGDIWVFDLITGLKRRINFSNSFNVAPRWSADGKTLAFVSNRGGSKAQLYQKPADGTGNTIPLFGDKALEEAVNNAEWTSDGRYLVYAGQSLKAIFAMPLSGDRKPFPVLEVPYGGRRGGYGGFAVSPDSKWMAYVRSDSGQSEIDVVPFPHGSGTWQVSTNGGSAPRWRRDGKEIFYLSPDKEIMAAEVSGEGGTFTVTKVVSLFNISSGRAVDVSPDGKKFVVVGQGAQQAGAPLTLVTNWPALLKRQRSGGSN